MFFYVFHPKILREVRFVFFTLKFCVKSVLCFFVFFTLKFSVKFDLCFFLFFFITSRSFTNLWSSLCVFSKHKSQKHKNTKHNYNFTRVVSPKKKWSKNTQSYRRKWDECVFVTFDFFQNLKSIQLCVFGIPPFWPFLKCVRLDLFCV